MMKKSLLALLLIGSKVTLFAQVSCMSANAMHAEVSQTVGEAAYYMNLDGGPQGQQKLFDLLYEPWDICHVCQNV